MNVFQKILLKIFEITDGKDNIDVDLSDLLKKEGFYSNIEGISGQLQDDGWITEAGRRHVVRITHWGAKEAKRLLEGTDDKSGSDDEIEKGAKVLVNDANQFVLLAEEFASESDPKKLDADDKSLSTLGDRV
jgi:hypothetical protein